MKLVRTLLPVNLNTISHSNNNMPVENTQKPFLPLFFSLDSASKHIHFVHMSDQTSPSWVQRIHQPLLVSSQRNNPASVLVASSNHFRGSFELPDFDQTVGTRCDKALLDPAHLRYQTIMRVKPFTEGAQLKVKFLDVSICQSEGVSVRGQLARTGDGCVGEEERFLHGLGWH